MSSNIIVIGDINVNLLYIAVKSEKFDELLHVYNVKNMISEPTCFKGDDPTLIDVCLVYNKWGFSFSHLNYNCGLSDCHNILILLAIYLVFNIQVYIYIYMIVISTNLTLIRNNPKVLHYRTYKKFNF